MPSGEREDMEKERSIPLPSGERVIASFFVSVTVGTIIFVVTTMLSRVTTFESATNFSLWQKAIHLMTMMGLLFVLSWMVGLTAAAIPCALLSVVARTLRIRSWIFYMFAGIAVGLMMVPIYVGFFNSFHWYADPPDETAITWFQGIPTVGRFLGPAGAVAGLTFWKLAGRYYR
ncbi:conserved membrane hypothetical protein [Paraburkholderia sacchari]